MIPQMHDDKIQGEEQLPSSVEEKQTGAPFEEQQKQISPRPQRWRQWLMRILGVALPFASVFMLTTPLQGRQYVDPNIFNLMIFGTFLMVFVGAALLRSWWALLIVPVACEVAVILGFVLFWPIGGDHFWDALSTILPLALLPIIICTAFGAGCGIIFSKWLKKRQHQ